MSTFTLNVNTDLKTTRKRTAQRDWVDSFAVADIAEDGSLEVGSPELGAAIATPEQFGFEDVDELRTKLQSAINGATQADPERKYKVHVYASDGVLVIRLA